MDLGLKMTSSRRTKSEILFFLPKYGKKIKKGNHQSKNFFITVGTINVYDLDVIVGHYAPKKP